MSDSNGRFSFQIIYTVKWPVGFCLKLGWKEHSMNTHGLRGVYWFSSQLIGLFGSCCSVKKKIWVITENWTEPKISITESNREPNQSSVGNGSKPKTEIYSWITLFIFFKI